MAVIRTVKCLQLTGSRAAGGRAMCSGLLSRARTRASMCSTGRMSTLDRSAFVSVTP
jgi:hypothetical protein